MNPKDRDFLLARIDERTCNIWRSVEKLERHNAEQNGYILQVLQASNRNTVWRRVIVGVGGTAIVTLLSWIAKLQGLW